MLMFPNVLLTTHNGQDVQSNGFGLSPRLWKHLQGQNLSTDGSTSGYGVIEDFLNFGAIAPAISGTTAGTAHGGYGYYVDTATSACSIKNIATAVGGVCQFSNGATDNHESWLTSGGNSGVLGKVASTSSKKMIFEAKFRVGQVADSLHNVFIGLSEEGLAAADTVTDAGALASKDFLGFTILEGDGDALKFVYRKAGQAMQTLFTYGTALSASTWYNVGFVFDPEEEAAKRIKIYINNVEQTTYVTATNISAATFPDGEELAYLAGIKNGAATAVTLDVDGWAFWQAG